MFINPIRRLVVKEYWITYDLTSTPAFAMYIISCERFVIFCYLHFADDRDAPDEYHLWKLCFLFSNLREKFSKLFKPFQNIVTDEFLLFFHGHFFFFFFFLPQPIGFHIISLRY